MPSGVAAFTAKNYQEAINQFQLYLDEIEQLVRVPAAIKHMIIFFGSLFATK